MEFKFEKMSPTQLLEHEKFHRQFGYQGRRIQAIYNMVDPCNLGKNNATDYLENIRRYFACKSDSIDTKVLDSFLFVEILLYRIPISTLERLSHLISTATIEID